MSRSLDPSSGLPLYLQVARLLQEEIAAGGLAPGDDVPSLRAMSSLHRVNIHTVAKAYQLLERDGVLTRRRGEPYRVADGAAVARELLREDVETLVTRAESLGVGGDELFGLLHDALAARGVRSA